MKVSASHIIGFAILFFAVLAFAPGAVSAQIGTSGNDAPPPGASFTVANVFTPNGDGINDVYIPANGLLADYTLRVYNRSGQELFKGTPARHWDGQSDGRALPAGVYIYSLEGRMANGDFVRRSGSVTLIR